MKNSKKYFTLKSFVILLILISLPQVFPQESLDILLKTGHLILEKGVDQDVRTLIKNKNQDENSHLFVQFTRDLSISEKEELRRNGVSLMSFVPKNSWYISMEGDKINYLENKNYFRSLTTIKPSYKISPILTKEGGSGKIIDNKNNYYLVVLIHKDINLDESIPLINQVGGIAINKISIINGLTIFIQPEKISDLAALDEVVWIEPVPGKPEDQLDQSRDLIGASLIQENPYNLDKKIDTLSPSSSMA